MRESIETVMRTADDAGASSGLGVQIVSFLLVGGFAALAFVLVSSAAIWLLPGLPDWLVSAGCYAGFIVPVYLLHRRHSFRSRAPHRQALPRYAAVQLLGLTLATLFSFVAYRLVALPTPVSATIVIGLTAGVNFTILRLWAFAHR
jgi:putative flippase GtrA